MTLIINSFLEGDTVSLRFKLAVVGIMWLIVAVAICADLISGYQKAKRRGEVRTSYGLRQTVNKAVLYYAMMLFAFMFDCIGTFFYPLPYVTLIVAAFLIFIECKSILEKAHEKDRRKIDGSLENLLTILENKDLLKGISEVARKQIEERRITEDEKDK